MGSVAGKGEEMAEETADFVSSLLAHIDDMIYQSFARYEDNLCAELLRSAGPVEYEGGKQQEEKMSEAVLAPVQPLLVTVAARKRG